MGQVASDASDFQGDLTQWLSMQGPLQAQESPTLKATAGATGAQQQGPQALPLPA